MVKKRDFIISTTSDIDTPFPKIEINTDNKLYDQNEILTIDDYVKFIVTSCSVSVSRYRTLEKAGYFKKKFMGKKEKIWIFKKK